MISEAENANEGLHTNTFIQITKTCIVFNVGFSHGNNWLASTKGALYNLFALIKAMYCRNRGRRQTSNSALIYELHICLLKEHSSLTQIKKYLLMVTDVQRLLRYFPKSVFVGR